MSGKSKCKILKDIRKKIAEENDIAYVTSECKYQGECSGTCPKCEAELRYLEEELAKRKNVGKAVAVAGVAAALVVGTASCVINLHEPTAGTPTPCPIETHGPELLGEAVPVGDTPEGETVVVGDIPEGETIVMGASEIPEDPT